MAIDITDITLLKKCANASKIVVAQIFQKKMANQLWYLSPELVCLALFDENVPDATKIKMAKNIMSDNNIDKARIKKGKFFFKILFKTKNIWYCALFVVRLSVICNNFGKKYFSKNDLYKNEGFTLSFCVSVKNIEKKSCFKPHLLSKK